MLIFLPWSAAGRKPGTSIINFEIRKSSAFMCRLGRSTSLFTSLSSDRAWTGNALIGYIDILTQTFQTFSARMFN